MRLLVFLFLAGCAVKCEDSSYYVVQMPEDLPSGRKPLQVFWNVPTMQCTSKKIPFQNLERFGIIQNTNDSFRGDKIAILYDPGFFPALLRNETSGKIRFRNGGVPQEGSLEAHLRQFREFLQQSIPDEKFSGIGIIDFESWRPILRQNFGDVYPYKTVSYDIERSRHWWWPEAWIKTEAKQRFEEAAKAFMNGTLALAKYMRPFARWGYYGFPYCFNMAASTMQEDCYSNVKTENDQINWLWRGSTALYPSVYSSKDLTTNQLRQLIAGRVREAARERGKDALVLPYFWFRYRDGSFLSQVDLQAALKTFNQSEANGFIIWGSSNDVNTPEKCKKLLNYIENFMGPEIAKYAKPKTKQDDEVSNDILKDEIIEENNNPNTASSGNTEITFINLKRYVIDYNKNKTHTTKNYENISNISNYTNVTNDVPTKTNNVLIDFINGEFLDSNKSNVTTENVLSADLQTEAIDYLQTIINVPKTDQKDEYEENITTTTTEIPNMETTTRAPEKDEIITDELKSRPRSRLLTSSFRFDNDTNKYIHSDNTTEMAGIDNITTDHTKITSTFAFNASESAKPYHNIEQQNLYSDSITTTDYSEVLTTTDWIKKLNYLETNKNKYGNNNGIVSYMNLTNNNELTRNETYGDLQKTVSDTTGKYFETNDYRSVDTTTVPLDTSLKETVTISHNSDRHELSENTTTGKTIHVFHNDNEIIKEHITKDEKKGLPKEKTIDELILVSSIGNIDITTQAIETSSQKNKESNVSNTSNYFNNYDEDEDTTTVKAEIMSKDEKKGVAKTRVNNSEIQESSGYEITEHEIVISTENYPQNVDSEIISNGTSDINNFTTGEELSQDENKDISRNISSESIHEEAVETSEAYPEEKNEIVDYAKNENNTGTHRESLAELKKLALPRKDTSMEVFEDEQWANPTVDQVSASAAVSHQKHIFCIYLLLLFNL